MRNIIAITVALAIAGSVLAQGLTPQEYAAGITRVLGNDMDATSCSDAVAGVYGDLGGACYQLDYIDTDFHRTMLDMRIGRYADIRSVAPWERHDGGFSRIYVNDDGLLVVAILYEFGNGSIGGFVPLEE